MKRVFAILMGTLWLGLAALHAQAGDARPLAAKVDARYNSMKSLRAEFTEIYSGGGVHRRESGTLLIKRPGKMRWDYTAPRKKLFVTSGNAAWFYVPGERQARKTPLKSLNDFRTPLRYLLGNTRLEKELRGLSLATDVAPAAGGSFVLRGVPSGMENSISQVLIEGDGEGLMRRIVIFDLDGSTTEFRLEHQQVNAPVSEDEFKFVPPPGVEVMQGKEMQP